MSARFPFPVLPTRGHRPVAGLLVAGLGWLLLAFGLVGVFVAGPPVAEYFQAPSNHWIHTWPLWLVWGPSAIWLACLLGMPYSVRLIRYGQRMRQRSALEVLAKDGRAPVLYLRSFDDDDLEDPNQLRGVTRMRKRFEERIARALRAIGPLVSVGRPGEPAPELGAARLYVRNEDWQAAVESLLGLAAAVVILIGRTEGVWWEIKSAVGRRRPERLLLFFPQAIPVDLRRSGWGRYFRYWLDRTPRRTFAQLEREREARYALFRDRSAAFLPAALPGRLGESQFIAFDADWRPRLLVTERPPRALSWLMLTRNDRMNVNFGRTLRPFVAQVRASPAAAGEPGRRGTG